jgi:hypothetical protein
MIGNGQQRLDKALLVTYVPWILLYNINNYYALLFGSQMWSEEKNTFPWNNWEKLECILNIGYKQEGEHYLPANQNFTLLH